MLEDYVAVSVLALYYDVPSSNHAEVYILELCKINDKQNRRWKWSILNRSVARKTRNNCFEPTVESSLGMLTDLEAALFGGSLRVEQVPDDLIVDLQHRKLDLEQGATVL